MQKKIVRKLNNNSSDIKTLYDEFVLERSVECRAKTLQGYKYKILPFVNWLDENNKLLNQASVNEYILFLKDKYPNHTTVNTNLRAIKTFVRWVHNKGKCNHIQIKVSKDTLKIKSLYTDEEIQKMIKPPDKMCSWTEYRDWTIINTLIGTGMRLGSLICIKIEDIDFDNDFITLTHTKNGKGQLIPISISLKKVLMEYLNTWDHTNEDFLFPNQYGKKFSSVQSITKIVNRYNKKRSISKTSSHLIRHTFAHNYIMNNGDIFRLSKLLGHSDIEVTRIYSNISKDDLKIDFNKMNLLDNMSKKKISCNLSYKKET